MSYSNNDLFWLWYYLYTEKRAAIAQEQKKVERKSFSESYRADSVLGQGGFGIVYKACRLSDNKHFAVKVVHFPTTANEQAKTLKEVETMKSLQHPNIVRYIDSWLEEDANKKQLLYLQMELCEQSNLNEWMNKWGQQTIEVTYPRCVQLLEGVAFIHSRGVIHRDLKPENIFVDANHSFKIGDFGISKTGQPSKASSTMNNDNTIGIGTPLFMPSEQKLGPSYTNKVDVYALGLIMFALIKHFPSHLRYVYIHKLAVLGQWPPNFTTPYPNKFVLIKSMIDKNPNNRPSCAKALEYFK